MEGLARGERLAAPIRDREVPTLRAFAVCPRDPAPPAERSEIARLLDEDEASPSPRYAATSRADLRRQLRPDGALLGSFLGARRLDQIDAADLSRWWEGINRGRALNTAKNYLNTLAVVLRRARRLRYVEGDAIRGLREEVREDGRTKRGRAAKASKARPIEAPEAIDALVKAAGDLDPYAQLFVLLGLDAGLRVGEIIALRWDRIAYGRGPDDAGGRYLIVDATRSRGGPIEAPKSGRARRVALSRRLSKSLRAAWVATGQPGSGEFVFRGLDPANFARTKPLANRFLEGAWPRILQRARLAGVRPKDLRDTYASHLLSAGVSLAYVSHQLGHGDVGVTARHYARWTGGDAYREPPRLAPGDVPADLMARLGSGVGLATGMGAPQLKRSWTRPVSLPRPPVP